MAIVLTPATEIKLRDRAGHDGRDCDRLAKSVLAAFLDGRMARVGPDIPYVTDDDHGTPDVLIAEADANFAAGAFKSLEQLVADKQAQFGIEL